MNRPVAVADIALFALTTVCAGAFVTNKWLRDPFLDDKDSHNHVWRVQARFRGQVKEYDLSGTYLGLTGTDSGAGTNISADVELDGQHFAVQGAGRHALRDAKGSLLGYAELVPETPVQRLTGKAEYLRRMGIDEVIPGAHGDNDGDRVAIGFFGQPRELTFRLTGGPVTARFTRVDNGHIITNSIVSGTASGTAEPVFAWTQNGKTQILQGFGQRAVLTLPGGSSFGSN